MSGHDPLLSQVLRDILNGQSYKQYQEDMRDWQTEFTNGNVKVSGEPKRSRIPKDSPLIEEAQEERS